MRQRALILLAGGQLCFLIGVIMCVAIRPEGLDPRVNVGISYYGVFRPTLPFYLVSLLGSALFSLLGARFLYLEAPYMKVFRNCLITFALMIIIVALTPYIISLRVYWIHTLAGTTAFAAQFVLSIWLLSKLRWAAWPLLLVMLEILMGLASLRYILMPGPGLLLQSQIAFQLAYGALLLYSVRKLFYADEDTTRHAYRA